MLQQNVIKFVQDDEKMREIKFDMAFKGVVKNLGIMILVGLVTQVTMTLQR